MIPFTKRIAGIILVLIGIAGVFLPLMPGVIFIVLGMALLGSNHRLVVKIKSMARDRLSLGTSEPHQTEEAEFDKTTSEPIPKIGKIS